MSSESEQEQSLELKNFFEAIEALAEKERDDADFQLMKKAVSSIWANLKED